MPCGQFCLIEAQTTRIDLMTMRKADSVTTSNEYNRKQIY